MKEVVRYFIEITLDFEEGYPDDLTATKEQMMLKYSLKSLPSIKNLLGGNRVILLGEFDKT